MLEDLASGTDYEVVARLARGRSCVFEFGTFIGGSAMAMLPEIKGANGKLYCIDHFQGNCDDPYTAHPRREVVDALLGRTEPYWPWLTVIIGCTHEAFNFPAGYADMCFIDAEHSYQEVVYDIRAARHLVQRAGGVICGHDYLKHYYECDPELMAKYSESPDGGYGGVGYGVIRAVHEAFGRPNHEGAVWWVIV